MCRINQKTVLRICDGFGYALKMTNPHLFLMNYSIDDPAVISLGDDLCLDELTSEIKPRLDELTSEIKPLEVYVIDETCCRCGTCDLSWMLDGWYCPHTWHSATTGFSDSSSDSDALLRGTSSHGEAPVLLSSDADGDVS